MNPWTVLISAIIGYLLGSLSFARIVMRIKAPDVDISDGVDLPSSSGDPTHLRAVAGTAVATQLGDRYGCVTAIGDILKAAIPA